MSDDTTSTVGDDTVVEKRKRILIVDDEVDITAAYSLLFELHGFHVVTAANGRHAIDLIDLKPPDIVLSDCMMPIMDGIELVRLLRGNPKTAQVPIILMSALPDPQKLSKSGHDLFMQKPVKFSALLSAVESMLSDA